VEKGGTPRYTQEVAPVTLKKEGECGAHSPFLKGTRVQVSNVVRKEERNTSNRLYELALSLTGSFSN